MLRQRTQTHKHHRCGSTRPPAQDPHRQVACAAKDAPLHERDGGSGGAVHRRRGDDVERHAALRRHCDVAGEHKVVPASDNGHGRAEAGPSGCGGPGAGRGAIERVVKASNLRMGTGRARGAGAAGREVESELSGARVSGRETERPAI